MVTNEIQLDDLTFPERIAFALAQSAIRLDIARQSRDQTEVLADALSRNLEIWVAISFMVERPDCSLTDKVKENLIRLSKFVSDITMIHGSDIGEGAMDTIINIDLQISEGLLEGMDTDYSLYRPEML